MQAIANKGVSWRIIDIINWGEEYFDKNDFESPKQEIEWLLCDLLNYKRVDLYVNFEEIVSPSKLKLLKEWIKKRLKRMPLQYICLLYTSPSPRDRQKSRMPSSA